MYPGIPANRTLPVLLIPAVAHKIAGCDNRFTVDGAIVQINPTVDQGVAVTRRNHDPDVFIGLIERVANTLVVVQIRKNSLFVLANVVYCPRYTRVTVRLVDGTRIIQSVGFPQIQQQTGKSCFVNVATVLTQKLRKRVDEGRPEGAIYEEVVGVFSHTNAKIPERSGLTASIYRYW